MAGEKEARWSLRSGHSLQAEAMLRGQVAKLRERAGNLDTEIAKHREDKERYLAMMQRGSSVGEELLAPVLAAIEKKELLLRACNEQAGRIEAQIESFLAEEEASLPERQAQQEFVAQLAQKIVAKDAEIEREISRLRKLLEERREMSAEISSGCRLLGFFEDGDWQRLQTLVDALPQSVLPESRRWADRFLGNKEGLCAFVVIAEHLNLSECLAHSGFYAFGETVYLSESEAQRCLHDPPSIMRAEEFRGLEEEARELGYPLGLLISARRADTRRPTERQ